MTWALTFPETVNESEAESIQMPFGVWSQVRLVKCVLGGDQIPRGRGYFGGMFRPIENYRESLASVKVTCKLAAAMRPFTVRSATTDVVVIVFLQAEESNDVETAAANDIHFPLEVTEVTGGRMRPVVKLMKMDLTRLLLLFIMFHLWLRRCRLNR